MGLIVPNLSMNISFLKRSTKYISVTIDDLNFQDIILLSVPCSLSKYLKTWKIKECKSVFSYDYFQSVEQLENYEEFPPFLLFKAISKVKIFLKNIIMRLGVCFIKIKLSQLDIEIKCQIWKIGSFFTIKWMLSHFEKQSKTNLMHFMNYLIRICSIF